MKVMSQALVFHLAFAVSLAQAQPLPPTAETRAAVAPPDTPAGKQLAAFVEAFNSGERATLRLFYSTHFKNPDHVAESTDHDAGFYKTARGFEVRRIAESSPEQVTAIVQSRLTENWFVIKVRVTPQPPHDILDFGYRTILPPRDMVPRQRLTESEIREKVDALITRMAEADVFSGAVLVAKDGKPIYEKACGIASRVWKAPNRIDTRFNIASLGKMFTAVAVAQLAERGKLSYEDTVGKFLPDYPNEDVARKVTVHHLLTHTSGLGSRSLSSFRKGFRTLEEYFPSFVNEPLRFEPGSRFDYSNDGYLLLGAIVEKASGRDYYDYVREHVYGPAGMTGSDCYDLDTDPPNLATGYMDGPDGTRRNNVFRLPVRGLPFGLGYSTVEDLLKFDSALRSHKLLGAESTDTLWKGKVDDRQGGQYGYGFFVNWYNGARAIGHGGGWSGITNRMDMFPDLGYTYVILSNYDAETPAISFKLREWLTQGHP
jgi:CubicO group peptidase (beta-lactamase class C family)